MLRIFFIYKTINTIKCKIKLQCSNRDDKNTRAHGYPRIKSAMDNYYPQIFITRRYFNTRL